MPKQSITIELDVPSGYEATGEYRQPAHEDWVLWDGKAYAWANCCWINTSYVILRAKPPEKRRGWVNVYPDGCDSFYRTKDVAERCCDGRTRIALCEVEYEVPQS